MSRTELKMEQAEKVNGGGWWEDRWNEFYEDLSEGAALIRDVAEESVALIRDTPEDINRGGRIILKDYFIRNL